MSAKKARGDSKLKTLPPAVQAELFEQCKQSGGYKHAATWLLDHHSVKTSTGALSKFFGWYPFSLSATASYAQQFEEELAKLPEMAGKAEQLSRIGQVGFEIMAMRTQDLEGYATLKKLRLKEVDQEQVNRRITLLEKAAAQADKAKAITGNDQLSDAEKAAQMRSLFGMG